jgi:hypothetical protein
MDGELPARHSVPLIFDELDFQLACQAYLWALLLVSYAQWQQQHREVFGATDYDLVRYVTYRDRLGLITANATTPYILNFIDLSVTEALLIELPPGDAGGRSSTIHIGNPRAAATRYGRRPYLVGLGVPTRGEDYSLMTYPARRSALSAGTAS